MKKRFDFKPVHLERLSLRVKKLVEKKEEEDKKIIKKIKKVFRF